MKAKVLTASMPGFEKTGACLYRYPSTGIYFALLKPNGKYKLQALKEGAESPVSSIKTSRLKAG